MTNDEINEYSKLIYSIMKRFKNYPNKDDLYQAGYIGLINAYQNYDSSYGAKFTTYAYPYILGEMYKQVCDDKNIKIGSKMNNLSLKLEKAINILSQKYNHYPTTKELSDFLEIDELEIIECMKIMSPVISTDTLITDDNLTLMDAISSQDTNIDTLLSLKEAINKLNDEEKFILNSNLNDYTQAEIAKTLGYNQVKVSRELTKIKQKIKSYVA